MHGLMYYLYLAYNIKHRFDEEVGVPLAGGGFYISGLILEKERSFIYPR